MWFAGFQFPHQGLNSVQNQGIPCFLFCIFILLGQPVHSKGDQSWVFFERNDAEAETPVFWPPHAKSWLIRKDSDAGRDWGQEEKRMTEDEMTGWHHRLDGREFEWTPGVGDGQGGLECRNSWGRKESDTTEWLNWTSELRSLEESFLDPYMEAVQQLWKNFGHCIFKVCFYLIQFSLLLLELYIYD